MIKLSEIKPNPENPRVIKDDKFKKLCSSIEKFPKMMQLRPIVVDENNIILGGNMRLKALQHLGFKEVRKDWIKKASELTEEEKKEFIIKDNVGFGEWDWVDLGVNWDADKLDEWGLDVKSLTETEKLSKIEFDTIYYEPTEKPNIDLKDCIDFDKYNQKKEVIESSNLSNEQKEILTFFAYRFIKIDFENVANYYAFNACEEEKEVIERLRLVLCDGGIDGFIEDDLLKIHGLIEEWSDDD